MTDYFEGYENRECGDHRTTGSRAWCFNCTEWCYPRMPCIGCEIPLLREFAEKNGFKYPWEEKVCDHPYVSQSWIGYSGYTHCHECGKIVEEK